MQRNNELNIIFSSEKAKEIIIWCEMQYSDLTFKFRVLFKSPTLSNLKHAQQYSLFMYIKKWHCHCEIIDNFRLDFSSCSCGRADNSKELASFHVSRVYFRTIFEDKATHWIQIKNPVSGRRAQIWFIKRFLVC